MDHVDDFNTELYLLHFRYSYFLLSSNCTLLYCNKIALLSHMLHFYIATTTPEILFARHGRIKKIKLYTSSDGKKKGDALVTYVRPDSVSKACLQVHCVTIRLHYCIMLIAELCCCIVLCIILLYCCITFLLYYYYSCVTWCYGVMYCTVLYVCCSTTTETLGTDTR